MSLPIKRLSMLSAFAVAVMLAATEDVQAQCSRGGPGSGSASDRSLAAGAFTPLVSPAASRNTFASQSQRMLQQQQMLAMRQRQMQPVAQASYDRQQSIQATRLARAEAKRAKRADRATVRIAALKAKRATELDRESNVVMLASTTLRETNSLE